MPARKGIVPAGPVTLKIECPNCGVTGQVTGTIGARLTVTEDGDSTVRATLRTKPVEHECGEAFDEIATADRDQLALVPEEE